MMMTAGLVVGVKKLVINQKHNVVVRFPFLNALYHHDDIWKPDIYFIKHGTFKVKFQRQSTGLCFYRKV